MLQATYRRLLRWNTAPMVLAPETRARLAGEFEDDVLRLGGLTGLDVSPWLSARERCRA